MAVYKIADVIFKDNKEEGSDQQSSGESSQEKSDLERVFDIIKSF